MNEIKVSKNLRYLRKKMDLNQEQVRTIFSITRSTWSNYENGVTTPSVPDLINFSRYFGVSLDELILHDLEEREPLPMKPVKRTTQRTVIYPLTETFSAASEPDFLYVLNELKRLREEINTIKNQ